MATKQWKIPTILRELQRAYQAATGADIMDPNTIQGLTVSTMVEELTQAHMHDQMIQIPGQLNLATSDSRESKTGSKDTSAR